MLVPHRVKGEVVPSEVAVNWEFWHWVLELVGSVVVTVLGWEVTIVSKVS